MSEIVPRWEWRTFGLELGDAEEFFAGLTPHAVQESDEVYFRTGRGAIVKIRDDLLDVKTLREVSPAGLEQWIPLLKQAFPAPAEVVAKVFEVMEVEAPRLEREMYTEEQFLAEVIDPDPQVAAVPIHKKRVRYTVDGCMAELTDLVVAGTPLRTIAIESEDHDAVLSAVRSAGLGDYLNHNFVRALTALFLDSGPRYAVIDVGTNSVKFHVGERSPDGTWSTVVDRAELTRLGEGQAPGGPISQVAMERTAGAITEMLDEARQARARAVAMVGTAALRSASNQDRVTDLIRDRTGFTVAPVTGEEEARLAYLAVKAGLDVGPGSLVVFDTGGGSSQFTFGDGDTVTERFSMPVGAVGYTEAYGLDGVVSRETLDRALAAIAGDLDSLDDRIAPAALVAMGGAVTNLTAVHHRLAVYDPDVVQGTVLERSEIDRQIELYRSMDTEARRSIVGLQPKRADVILAGACIVATVMDKLGQERLTVSDRGLRHGLLRERFGTKPA